MINSRLDKINSEARRLRDLVAKLDKEHKDALEQLKQYELSCPHNFSANYFDIIYDPIYTKGYTYPGDPPGTMGVDWRGPVYVPPTTTKRWRRTCRECGFVQYTTQIKKTVEEEPEW